MFEEVARLTVDPRRARVFEHGWQSWSPTTTYAVAATSHRPLDPRVAYRPGRPAPAAGFQGEGLLAVDPGGGEPVVVFGATGPHDVPSIRAGLAGSVLTVSADGPVREMRYECALVSALGDWAEGFAREAQATAPRSAPTGWCSWYHYFTRVTEDDVVENLEAIAAAGLPVDVIQIDDGWQAEIGDWTELSDRFRSLPALVARIHAAGRRAGIWVAPLLVGERSSIVRDHPEWLLGGASPVDAGHNWGQRLLGLDATHPGVAGYLTRVFEGLVDAGFDYFKLDFLYAGALDAPRADGSDPLTAYRQGLRLIREAVGAAPYIVGCGAPMLPSVGLVDAMRVSPDIAPEYEHPTGDPSMPSQVGATMSTVARAFLQGRFWVNDPDCLIVRPAVQRREEWAEVVRRFGGLRVCSDRIADLDAWGLEQTRELLATAPPPVPFPPDGVAS
jgi:alpha-galactosidase